MYLKKYTSCLFFVAIIFMFSGITYADASKSKYWKQTFETGTKCSMFYLQATEKYNQLSLKHSDNTEKQEYYAKKAHETNSAYAVTFVVSGFIINNGLVPKRILGEVIDTMTDDKRILGEDFDDMYLAFCDLKAKKFTKLAADLGLSETVLGIIYPNGLP